MSCKSSNPVEEPSKEDSNLRPTEEGRDYYFENGLMVLSEYFLKQRGYCCESGCRNCPYGFADKSKSE